MPDAPAQSGGSIDQFLSDAVHDLEAVHALMGGEDIEEAVQARGAGNAHAAQPAGLLGKDRVGAAARRGNRGGNARHSPAGDQDVAGLASG